MSVATLVTRLELAISIKESMGSTDFLDGDANSEQLINIGYIII